MPATQIATQVVSGPYPSLPVAALSLDLVFTAADVANGNFFAADGVQTAFNGTLGGDIILVWNTDTNPHNFTVTSQPDAQGRSGSQSNVEPYAIAAGVISAFKLSQLVGWEDLTSNVFLSADDATVKFAIIRR